VCRTDPYLITNLPKILLDKELVCLPLCDKIVNIDIIDIGFNTTSEIPWETISSERNSERQLPEDNLDLEEERGTTARISGPGGVQNNPIGHDGHMSRSRATVISGGYNVIGKRRKISADTAQPDIVREYERYSSSSVATVAAKGSEGLEVGLRQPSEELDQIPNGNNESEDTTEMVRTLGATGTYVFFAEWAYSC
jgi:hypothetical protein